jgi:hypothetical protein
LDVLVARLTQLPEQSVEPLPHPASELASPSALASATGPASVVASAATAVLAASAPASVVTGPPAPAGVDALDEQPHSHPPTTQAAATMFDFSPRDVPTAR